MQNGKFQTMYIDAFAGSGSVVLKDSLKEIAGSATIALSCSKQFDSYTFIEKNPEFSAELRRRIRVEFPDYSAKIRLITDDCNDGLIRICKSIDWRKTRAVLFLDPYNAGLKWSTLEEVAATKAIDVWYLFPLHAAIRMMKNNGDIQESWKKKLNEVFGDQSWFDTFYTPSDQLNLFGREEYDKEYSLDKLKSYVITRLKALFPSVSEDAQLLFNRNNVPLFLYCFATANDSIVAQEIAQRGANHILKMHIS